MFMAGLKSVRENAKQTSDVDQARRAGDQTSAQPGIRISCVAWLALAHFMRLSLTKAAHADFSGARVQEIRRRAGRRISKVAERRRRGTTFIPGCRASGAQTILRESMSQPSRAGLTFGPRPYGPGSDLRFALAFSRKFFSPAPSNPGVVRAGTAKGRPKGHGRG
jgi:hypothetical protein